MCVKMDKNVSKYPENQENGAQNFLKSGNLMKILMPGNVFGKQQLFGTTGRYV